MHLGNVVVNHLSLPIVEQILTCMGVGRGAMFLLDFENISMLTY